MILVEKYTNTVVISKNTAEKYSNTVVISTNTAKKYINTEEVSRANWHLLPTEWKLLS